MLSKNQVTSYLMMAVAWWGCAQQETSAQADRSSQFPYPAVVRSDVADVHSGPGKVHYVTARLSQGAAVEVYRHDPGGWCAIRPPKGSFSLVPATAMEELGNALGKITEEGAQAWVGTELGPVDKPLWQVKLRAGETVSLLGVATWPDPAGFTTSWYQITPPAGEFRWIKLSDLSVPAEIALSTELKHPPLGPPSEMDQVARGTSRDESHSASQWHDQPTAPFTDSAIATADYLADGNELRRDESSIIEQANYQQVERNVVQNPDPPVSNSGWRRARNPIDRTASEVSPALTGGFHQSHSSPEPPERLASSRLDVHRDMEQLRSSESSFAGSTNFGTPHFGAAGYSAVSSTPRMTELELKLNQELVKEPNQWRLIDLQDSVRRLMESSTDSVEQYHAQRFLAKLENCRQIRDQYMDRSSSQRTSLGTDTRQSQTSGSDARSSNEFSLDTLYDAHGWLRRLEREGGLKDPDYVLQDENGKVTHHIAPGPGMNLSSYQSKRVGIIGQRGYNTKLKLNHVTAQKVIELK